MREITEQDILDIAVALEEIAKRFANFGAHRRSYDCVRLADGLRLYAHDLTNDLLS